MMNITGKIVSESGMKLSTMGKMRFVFNGEVLHRDDVAWDVGA